VRRREKGDALRERTDQRPNLPPRPALSLAAAIGFVGADLLLTGGDESIQLDRLSYELVLKLDGTRTVDDLVTACAPLTEASAGDLRPRIVELLALLCDQGYLQK
jgi:Coenzyme PQQ synthesis protein D (PqqD)